MDIPENTSEEIVQPAVETSWLARHRMMPAIIVSAVILAVFFLVGPYAFFSPLGRTGVTSIAITLHMPSVCTLVPPTDTCQGFPCARPDFCYRDVAAADKMPDACDNLNGFDAVAERNKCRLAAGEVPGITADTNCSHIIDGVDQGMCYSDAARAANDVTICDKGSNDVAKARCYIRFLEVATKPDIALCEEKAPPDADGQPPGTRSWYKYVGAYKNACYALVAKGTIDLSLCKKITKEEEVATCRDEIYRAHVYKSVSEAMQDPDKVYSLNLYGQSLSALPPEVLTFKHLHYLYLGKNNFTEIPVAQVSTLKELETLDLDQNRLTSIPSDIGKLAYLKFLNLRANPSLPDYSVSLKKLLPNTSL